MMRLLPVLALLASVTLTWDANSEPTLAGYRLYHATSAGGPYTLAATVGKVTTWEHQSLAAGLHCWVATAYDTSGNESAYSNEACRTVTGAPQTVQLRNRVRFGGRIGP